MKLLATPYERGNADQIVSRPFSAKVAEGLAVYEDADGCHLMTAGKTPSGIAARQGLAAGEKLVSGREIYVRCADDKVVVKVGDPVYIVPATGLFSAKSAENIKINATFRFAEIVKARAANGTVYDAYCIDMPAPMEVINTAQGTTNLADVTGTLAIANGGTGATEAAQALKNLGGQPKA